MTYKTKQKINFKIIADASISKIFIAKAIHHFNDACTYIQYLPYGRNKDKDNLVTLFSDNFGTCSTKHAVLKQLANENGFTDIKLVIGLFKMNGSNTPKIAETLKQHQLNYLPEAHCYLKYNDEILDFTKPTSQASDFNADLLEEISVEANQINTFKIDYHKNYLANWLKENKTVSFNLDEIWKIREQCIQNLTNSTK
jgi:hypothetical protein